MYIKVLVIIVWRKIVVVDNYSFGVFLDINYFFWENIIVFFINWKRFLFFGGFFYFLVKFVFKGFGELNL